MPIWIAPWYCITYYSFFPLFLHGWAAGSTNLIYFMSLRVAIVFFSWYVLASYIFPDHSDAVGFEWTFFTSTFDLPRKVSVIIGAILGLNISIHLLESCLVTFAFRRSWKTRLLLDTQNIVIPRNITDQITCFKRGNMYIAIHEWKQLWFLGFSHHCIF